MFNIYLILHSLSWLSTGASSLSYILKLLNEKKKNNSLLALKLDLALHSVVLFAWNNTYEY